MDEKMYYFHDMIENDSLRCVSQKAKELLQEIGKVVKIFESCNKVLHGESSRQFEFLMTLDDQSHSWNDSCSSRCDEKQLDYVKSEIKPNQQRPISTKKNINVPDFSQKQFLRDQADKENHESSNQIKHQIEINSSNEKKVTNLCSIDKTIANGQKFVHSINSKDVKTFGINELDYKKSFSIAEKDTMTNNNTVDDKQSLNPSEMSKMANNSYGNNQKYSSSAEITLTSCYTTQNKDLSNSVEVVKTPDNKHNDNQNSGYLFHKAKIPDYPDPKSKLSLCQHENTKMFNNWNTQVDEYANPCKKYEILDDNRSNSQDSVFSDETILNMTNSTKDGQESSSFVKKTEKTIILNKDDKMTNPKEKQKIENISEENEKASCPSRKSVLFGSIPRVKKSNGTLKIVILSSCEADGDSELKSFQILPDYYRIDQKAKKGKCSSESNIGNAAAHDSKIRISSTNINGGDLKSSEKNLDIPSKDNVFQEKYVSSDSLTEAIMAREYQSGVSLPPSLVNCSDPNVMLQYMTNFVKFCEMRTNSMREIYNSFRNFLNHLLYLYSFVKDIENVIQSIPLKDMEYSIEEFQELKLIAITTKLMDKLSSWIKDVQSDVTVLNQFFQQIQGLKLQNKPFIIKGMPIVRIDFLRMYAQNLKEIWQKMDAMVTRGYTRRTFFFQTAHDFEKLITNFTKCLIIIGVLKPRKKTKE